MNQISKGDKIFCEVCEAHICTFAKDLKPGFTITPEHFEPKEGQSPWQLGDPMNCKKCGTPWCNGESMLGVVPKEFLN